MSAGKWSPAPSAGCGLGRQSWEHSLRGLWTRERHFLAKYWKPAFYTCPHPSFQASIYTHILMWTSSLLLLTTQTLQRLCFLIDISSSKTNSNQFLNYLNPFWILPTGFLLIILHDTPHKIQACLLHTPAGAALLLSHPVLSFYPTLTFFWSKQRFGLKMPIRCRYLHRHSLCVTKEQ